MERMKRRWNAWLNGKSGAYAVVEATILFPIIMMVFAGLVLLSVYLPTRTILQRGTQYAAEDVDALVELISEVQSSTADAVRLGKEQIPIEIIKERFRQLTQMHVAYILDSLRTTTTQINNIKAYLLTALYNAPTTMGFFYSAQVRHDLRRK